MKKLYIPILALILSGCVKRSSVEFEGNTPGIKDGVFIIKTTGDSSVYGENIKDGHFSIPKKQLKYPDYYLMNITDGDTTDKHEPFEVYLEDGKYTVETEAGHLYKYPRIISSSKIQQQLSAFYTMVDQLSAESNRKIDSLNAVLKVKGNGLQQQELFKLLNKLSKTKNGMINNNVVAFRKFVQQFPNSGISAHLMTKINYDDDPVSFYAIYKTLSPEARNSEDGKEIGEKLSHLVKLIPGSTAPAIIGKTPDGKAFDPKSINKKYILVEFWRVGNDFSRSNHQELLDMLQDKDLKNKLGIISVSLDTRQDWWTAAIEEDHLTWPQVCDLKGDDSPNTTNWSISTIPTYYLLDGNWKIVIPNIPINRLNFEVTDYIDAHH
jgi:hypothetical protein